MRISLPGLAAWLGACLILVGTMSAGCAARPDAAPRGVAEGPPPADAAPLDELIARRDRLAAEVRAFEDRVAEFRRQNPVLTVFDLVAQEVRLLSEKRLNAELAVIDARSRYGSGHPQLEAATRREGDIARRFEVALGKLMAVEARMLEYDRMSIDLEEKRSELRRLDEYLIYTQIRRR